MSKQETMTVDEWKKARGEWVPQKGEQKGNIRPRHTPGVMNKVEQRMDYELDLLKRGGHIKEYHFEAVKLKLAKRTTFTVDFWIFWADGTIEARDVKGGPPEDDFMVKIKVAAAMFRQFKFTIHAAQKGGTWNVTEITP